ncbi:MAG: alpha/beta fold hydrolase [Desulfobacteraceae bacterium]|nr:alpha/beta fold hydrolase [Desulfobacteraceae bacterium]
MNSFAYRTTGLAIKTLSGLSRANIQIHGSENIPEGSIVFVVNHFTRIETLLLPYHIHHLTQHQVWSLADAGLFVGAFGAFLEQVGALSTQNPDRDRLIVKTLLTGEAHWIIFPEGRMVKNKKILENGRFMVSYAGGKHPPHTGAATLAIRTEFYRQRLLHLWKEMPEEAERLQHRFQIESLEILSGRSTHIVPVNITYYPIRARENVLSQLASILVEDIPDRAIDEIMTEGTMLLSGVDMDIRFGKPIPVVSHLRHRTIRADITRKSRIDFNDALSSLPRMRKEALLLMRRYMTDIYRMTTVNHDHLFAVVFKKMPLNRIDEMAFRRKVYAAAVMDLERLGVFCHDSLRTDQLHLIVDDRYGKYRDFERLALQTRIAAREGSDWVRNNAKFDGLFHFDRARMENPVAVIANEVEPLQALERAIRHLAWIPDFWLRRRIAWKLLRQDLKCFDDDYAAYHRDGQSRAKRVGRPYFLRGGRDRIGVVLVHGYMAAPYELKDLADYLGARGLWVYVPRLRGHGTSPEDLALRTHNDWIDSVNRAYAVISGTCKEVVVGGFSTGAGLALELAARVKGLSGVFAVAPPLRLQDFSARFAPAVDTWNRLMERVRWRGAMLEFVANEPENPHINYTRNPVSGIHELERLMDAVAEVLPSIHVPALVIQSDRDPVVQPGGARKVFDRLESENKSLLFVNFQRHGILLGEEAHTVHQAIHHFIRRVTRSER